jgi:hypothetical protein
VITREIDNKKSPVRADEAFRCENPTSASGSNDTHLLTLLWATSEKLHFAIGRRKQGVIFTDSNVGTGVKSRAALTNNNAACRHFLTTKNLDAKTFTFGVASVAGTSPCFLVCHALLLLLALDTGDFHLSEPLSVTSFVTIVLAAIELNNLDFVVTAMCDDLGGDLAALDKRRANLDVLARTKHQHLVELNGIASRCVQLFQLQDFAFHDTVLFTTADYDCVHHFSSQLACSQY